MNADKALNLADSGDRDPNDPLVVLAEEVRLLRAALEPLCQMSKPHTLGDRMRARKLLGKET